MLPQLKQNVSWADIGQLLTKRDLIDKPVILLRKTEQNTDVGLTLTFKLKIALSEHTRSVAMTMTYADASEVLALVGVIPQTTFECPLAHLLEHESRVLDLTLNCYFPHKEVMGT